MSMSHRTLLPSTLATLATVLLAAACGGGSDATPDAGPDAEPAPDGLVRPVFRNPVDLSDDALALQALQLLGADVEGSERNCDICHGMTRARFHGWSDLSTTAMSSCLTDLEVDDPADARAMIACLREDPEDESSPFDPAHLGMYATAVHLPWFQYLFALAYPEDWQVRHEELVDRALMPRGGHPAFDQADFDIIAEWTARGMPLVDSLVPETPTGDCTPEIGPEVAAHVAAMETQGWAAVNAAAGITMHGCAAATTARECLTTYPRASDTDWARTWEQDLPASAIRILYTMSYASSFWTRSSADGRFVAHGGGNGAGGSSTIIDLATPGRLIGTTAFYDPGFFPDNSGFAFQGGGASVCEQGLLSALPHDNFVDYSEAACNTASGVGLYQHMGASVGGDYWIVNSQWAGDNGGQGPGEDPGAWFDANATIRLIPMIHDGGGFQERGGIDQVAPYEGDTVLSPAAELLVSRISSASGQAGYRLRKLDATPSGDSYTVETPVIATYCLDGAKPAISYDERWLITHHYTEDTDADAIDLGFTGRTDGGFRPYVQQGSANLHLVDLLSGDRIRITRMAPGQFALFPHFRSDGWIYFNVRTAGGPEHIAASDAALVAAGK
jgi:hypothetical protein